jgi:hypothetical protein
VPSSRRSRRGRIRCSSVVLRRDDLRPGRALQLAAQVAAKQAVPLPLTHETMCAIVEEAERLADGNERDEPGRALLCMCAPGCRVWQDRHTVSG